jgi:gliding motility-associated-like protein
VQVRKDCAIRNDLFAVVPGNTRPPFVRDTIICQHITAPLIASPDTGLVWYTQSSSGTGRPVQPTINTAQPGRITLYVARQQGACLSRRVPVAITISETPASRPAERFAKCADLDWLQPKFGAPPLPDVRYSWNTGDTTCCISPEGAGYFIRVATNSCGSAVDSYFVDTVACERCVAFPDAFTPNGDGRNERFRPLVRCAVSEFRMSVYNRWGEAVYTADGHQGAWDGRFRGAEAPGGTYMYYASFTSVLSGKKFLVKGTVSLLR